ncbi:hypothetical protein IIA79_07440 [bacterium]|nr:hypothetical protein [bacterium]
MKQIDYSWIIILGIVVVIAIFWKPIMGLFGTVSDKVTNKEQYERGKAVFYNAERWGGEGSYKSCAMCHATDFVADAEIKIDMLEYKADEVWVLEKIGDKYSSGMLSADEELYHQIALCIAMPSRLAAGRPSRNASFVQDLIEYVRRQ